MKNLIIILGILLMCSPVFAGDMEPVLNNTKLFIRQRVIFFQLANLMMAIFQYLKKLRQALATIQSILFLTITNLQCLDLIMNLYSTDV